MPNRAKADIGDAGESVTRARSKAGLAVSVSLSARETN